MPFYFHNLTYCMYGWNRKLHKKTWLDHGKCTDDVFTIIPGTPIRKVNGCNFDWYMLTVKCKFYQINNKNSGLLILWFYYFIICATVYVQACVHRCLWVVFIRSYIRSLPCESMLVSVSVYSYLWMPCHRTHFFPSLV